MLVLSRKIGEKIHIDVAGGIEICVVGVRDGKVKVGILADRSIPVHRHEVAAKIDRGKHLEIELGGEA